MGISGNSGTLHSYFSSFLHILAFQNLLISLQYLLLLPCYLIMCNLCSSFSLCLSPSLFQTHYLLITLAHYPSIYLSISHTYKQPYSLTHTHTHSITHTHTHTHTHTQYISLQHTQVQAIILAPSRELVTQIGLVGDSIFKDTGINVLSLIGKRTGTGERGGGRKGEESEGKGRRVKERGEGKGRKGGVGE